MAHKCAKKFYVTTPIYYVNAKPHIGSLYSTVLADVAARWNRLCGTEVMFVTGLDEHGQKVAAAAAAASKEPQAFVDELAPVFKEVWRLFDCSYDYFIRTSDDYHVKAVQQWLSMLIERGDVYKASYTGWYCAGEEAFVTEKDLVIEGHRSEPLCAYCGRPTKWLEEECYYFRLSAYQERLLEFYKKRADFIVPKERLQEIIAFVEAGLKDLSISRTSISWGVPFPHDSKHVTYVWADALLNYVTAIGYGNSARADDFAYWWPADVHVMGKDIARFHAVYWLAFLMASGWDLPHHLVVHGWLKLGDQKISKSLGNVIDPVDLHEKYGSDVVRYYLVRYMTITQDSPFSADDLEMRATNDLANDLGNLVSRVSALVTKYVNGPLKPPSVWGRDELDLQVQARQMVEQMREQMDEFFFARAYARVWKFVQEVNSYIQAQTPWVVVKADKARFEHIMSAVAHALEVLALACEPVIPQSCAKIRALIGASYEPACEKDCIKKIVQEPWDRQFVIRATEPLFKKYG